MQFTGAQTTSADPATTYAFMTNPQAFFGCVPRVTDVRVKSSTSCEFKVGASGISLNCTARWRNLNEPHSFTLDIEGGNMFIGKVAVSTTTEISPHASSSEVRWTSDVRLSGLIARQVGQDQIEPMIDSFTRDVLRCFEEKHAG
jgi:carbon monoxide dehydrogenase subunit G